MLLSSGYKNAYAVLNRYASRVSGPELSFAVHFWGANPVHTVNSIHKHSSFWVGYVLSGQGRYSEQEFASPLAAGTIFCSRPHISRQIVSERGLSILWVSFQVAEEDSLAETLVHAFRRLGETKRIVRADAGNTPTAKLWEALWTQAERFQPADAPLLSAVAYALLLSFAQLFGEVRSEEGEGEGAGLSMSSVLLRQAKWFMAENVSFPLRLEDVARQLHISGRHLSRLFAEADGLSFSAYLRRLRIDLAIRDLIGTDKPLETIAQECGFVSIYYFTRVFTAETGLPPGRYRKQHGGA
ncbi:helix-turn-helix transcriptional regulator [Paenibacillus cymbidii]|uniref:helix-turn-helix transcriptional regulator n=1 Tax=Paenibacillus cymbidii TaxID=1639034 RepID=UPI0014368426|nr:AraC family transcriptional regulator [Paenibacillus cymbidii]